ncbi:transcriptional regulator, partial [Tannerella sp. oral taxon 808]
MTEEEIIRRESPEMEALFDGLASVAEQMSEIAATHRPLFGGDVYLTGREVTERLFISRRTLQDYRDRGLLPYTRIGGKMLYKL